MRSEAEIEAEIRELHRELEEARFTADWQRIEDLDTQLERLEIEMRDPAALLPRQDFRDVDDLIG